MDGYGANPFLGSFGLLSTSWLVWSLQQQQQQSHQNGNAAAANSSNPFFYPFGAGHPLLPSAAFLRASFASANRTAEPAPQVTPPSGMYNLFLMYNKICLKPKKYYLRSISKKTSNISQNRSEWQVPINRSATAGPRDPTQSEH